MPPALVDDLLEEVLIRFPPKDPAALVRAALVCKRWRRLVCGPGFRRRFAEFHRAPPMLGMFCGGFCRVYRRFEPTTAFRPRHAERAHKHVLDARHGRVLLDGGRRALVVWDPITGEERKVPLPRSPLQYMETLSWTAAVLCSYAGAGGCDHLDCHRGPFNLVLVRCAFRHTPRALETIIFTYTSDAAAWSEPICGREPGCMRGLVFPLMRSVLVGDALYFGFVEERTALKYNMQLHQMSWIQLPCIVPIYQILLTTTEDGGLGLATKDESKLYVWSRKDADEVDARWEQNRVIELKMLLPVDVNFTFTSLVGSMDGLGIIFMGEGNVVYAIDLKTSKWKKVCEGKIGTIVPYMSFYTPASEADRTGEGPSAGGSSA